LRRFLLLSESLVVSALALALLAGFIPQRGRSEEYRARFDHESNAVRKAKILPDLGNAEFKDIEAQAATGDFDVVMKTLQLYRDQVAEAEKALDATGANPAKHSAGFIQLEISVRQSLRRMDDLSFEIPPEHKKSFADIRNQLDQTDQRLIRQLFPRAPAPGAPPAGPHS